jgi:hypothetical protein
MQYRLTTDIWAKYAALEVHGPLMAGVALAGAATSAMGTIAGGANSAAMGRAPPAARREKLLDPAPGPQRFLTLWTRREMLAEIDDEARRAKRVA